MAPSAKTNFKTYDAQARLVRAMVAAHPEVKWKFEEIVRCFGSDMTKDALNHRFRRWRSETVIIQEGLKQGFDMANMTTDDSIIPKAQNQVDKDDIAKYFGQSTGGGVEFQFRQIKADAKKLRKVQGEGGDVAGCLKLEIGHESGTSSLPNTPSKPTPSRAPPSTSKRGRASAQRIVGTIKEEHESSDADNSDGPVDYDSLDMIETPSKRARMTPQPSRAAALSATPTRGRTSGPALTPSGSRQSTVEPSSQHSVVTSLSSRNEVSKPFDTAAAPSAAAAAAVGVPAHGSASIFGTRADAGASTPLSQSSHDGEGPLSRAFRQSGKDSFLGSQSSTQADTFTNSSFSLDTGEC